MLKKRRKILIGVAGILVCALGVLPAVLLPDRLTLMEGQLPERLNTRLVRFESAELPVGRSGALVGGRVTDGGASKEYTVQAKLFGILPVKAVSVEVVEPARVIAGGSAIGVKLYTGGLLVVGVSDFRQSGGGTVCPPREADLRCGDLITEVDGDKVSAIAAFSERINQTAGNPVTLTLERDGKILQKAVAPKCDATDGRYKLGLWVRDSTAGIGTLTFVEPQSSRFGALGHGIADADTGELLPLAQGQILPAKILSVKRGEKGSPGELRGAFSQKDAALGEVGANTDFGLYGKMTDAFLLQGETMETAGRAEVQVGEAQILCTVEDGQTEWFDIAIEKVTHLSDATSKGMVLRVTDPDLLAVTGGIVQGMSGSPILQNGKIVGAVTHVFVNDPTRGYGIFIENMLAEAEKVG